MDEKSEYFDHVRVHVRRCSHLSESCRVNIIMTESRTRSWLCPKTRSSSPGLGQHTNCVHICMVMFIVTTADRMLTTLPDVVQNQISRMLRPPTYARFVPTENGDRPLKYTTVRNLYTYHESTISLQVTCCLNLIFYEWIGTLFHISLALVWHTCTRGLASWIYNRLIWIYKLLLRFIKINKIYTS